MRYFLLTATNGRSNNGTNHAINNGTYHTLSTTAIDDGQYANSMNEASSVLDHNTNAPSQQQLQKQQEEKQHHMGVMNPNQMSLLPTNINENHLKNKITIVVPPGTLGLIIETTNLGPTVHTVTDTSPLIGFIHIGDIIVRVNEHDTSEMTSKQFTKLISKSGHCERSLTILR